MKRVLSFAFLCVVASMAFAASESDLFSEAEDRYVRRQYSLALTLYDDFVVQYPLSDRVPDVQYRRAVCLFRLERYGDSLDVLSMIGTRYRSTRYLEYVPFWQGVALYHMADYTRSIDTLRAFVAKTSDAELARQALLYQGISEVTMADFSAAKVTMRDYLDRVDEVAAHPYPVVLYAYALLREELYEQLAVFSGSVDVGGFPRQWKERLLLYRAEANWELDDIVAAERDYRVLTEAEEEIASVALRKLFLIAQRRNDVDGMERVVQQAEARFSSSPAVLKDMWVRLGIENFSRGTQELAEHFLLRVWNLRDREAVEEIVPLYLAELYVRRDDADRAVAVLKEYIERSEGSPAAVMMRLGDLHLAAGRFEEARAAYKEFVAAHPDHSRFDEAAYLLAYSSYRLDEFGEAMEVAERLMALPEEGRFHRDLLKLNILLLRRLGRDEDALGRLEEYTRRYRDDTRARLDLLRVLSALERHADLAAAAVELYAAYPNLQRDDPYAYVVAHYLQGLSLIAVKRYAEAVFAFDGVSAPEATRNQLATILPDTAFYRGWGLYRTNRYAEAAEQFLFVVDGYPEHDLYARAVYMAGWSNYSDGRFAEAAGFFSLLPDSDPETAAKAMFFLGKSLANEQDYAGAAKVFQSYSTQYPQGEFADDASFEYGATMVELGRVEEGAEAYRSLGVRYPDSPLREEALYRRADLYLIEGLYELARDAFYDFRSAFPRSPLVDAALYWGGLASFEAGEPQGAALLWERIIDEFPASGFRPEAIRKTAEVYADSDDYSTALNLYRELILRHPTEAAEFKAEARADELRNLRDGMGDREAELTAVIRREGRAETRAGREAMIELSRLYVFEAGTNMSTAHQMLGEVIAFDDAQTASTAQYFMGEYYFRADEIIRAGNEFLKAAFVDPSNRDLTAASIYRAAEMMKLAGKTQDVRELVGRLRESFPDSQWAEQGEKLLGDAE